MAKVKLKGWTNDRHRGELRQPINPIIHQSNTPAAHRLQKNKNGDLHQDAVFKN
jgi:hypothetical protein